MTPTPPIIRRSLEVAGRRVSYLTIDDVTNSNTDSVGGVTARDTLLLIHGAGVSARTWVNQLRGLAGVVRPIAIDLPGRRESDAADPTLATYADTAYETLRRLHSGPAFVAGHSLGGAGAIGGGVTARRGSGAGRAASASGGFTAAGLAGALRRGGVGSMTCLALGAAGETSRIAVTGRAGAGRSVTAGGGALSGAGRSM